MKEARQEAEQAERLRLYYVAMTRARERLIVSGSVDFGRASEVPTPIAWVLERLDADEELAAAGDTPLELARGDARLLVRVDRYKEETAVAEPASDEREAEAGQLALFAGIEEIGEAPPPAPLLPELPAIAAPPLLRVRRLSFTALSMFEQCGYKYWARYGIGLPEQEVPRGEGGLSGVEVGSAVHEILEHIDLAAPVVPEIENERVRAHVTAYVESPLAQRLGSLPGVTKERHFTFELDGVLVHGFLDVLQMGAESALVVDYKTNWIGESSPEEIVEADYRLQRLVYALACFRAGRAGGRGRSTRSSSARTSRSRRASRSPTSPRSKRSSPPRSRVSRPASSGRRRANSRAPAVPALDLVCAGPRLRQPPALVGA